jgi:uncharacterized protein (DUF58 family)
MDRERDRRPSRDPRLKTAKSRFQAPRSLRATRAGWCFIGIIFGVGFAALNTGNNLLYLVLALMLAFLVLSGFLSEASLRGIQVERALPREFFAASPNRVVLRICNQQRRISSFAILLEDRLEEEGGSVAAGRAFALRVGATEVVNRSYVLAPDRRGALAFCGVRVSTRFPFGLFVKSRELEVEDTALVYPQVFLTPVPEDARQPDRNPEEQVGQARQGDDVAGLREFVPGDGLGRVQWRRSLRAGRWLVGEREGDASGEVEILLSLGGRGAHSAFEERLSHTASEVVSALDAGLRVGLRSNSARFSPSTGFAHRTDLLTYLALVKPESSRDDSARATQASAPNGNAPHSARNAATVVSRSSPLSAPSHAAAVHEQAFKARR